VVDGWQTSLQGQCLFVCTVPRADLCFSHSATSVKNGAIKIEARLSPMTLSGTSQHILCECLLSVSSSKLTVAQHASSCIQQPEQVGLRVNVALQLPLPARSTICSPACRALSKSAKALMLVLLPICGAGHLTHLLN